MKKWGRLPQEQPVQPQDITFLNFFLYIGFDWPATTFWKVQERSYKLTKFGPV